MIRRGTIFAGMLAAAAALYGCGSDKSETVHLAGPDGRGLHLACQTVECECLGPRESLFADPPKTLIVWRENGEATCPAGFELKKIETDIFGRRQ